MKFTRIVSIILAITAMLMLFCACSTPTTPEPISAGHTSSAPELANEQEIMRNKAAARKNEAVAPAVETDAFEDTSEDAQVADAIPEYDGTSGIVDMSGEEHTVQAGDGVNAIADGFGTEVPILILWEGVI